jgi:hypothetical protein
MATARVLLALLWTAAIVTGCGPSGGGDRSPTAPADDPVVRPGPSALLTIEVADGEGDETTATVRCAPGADRATGYLRLEQPAALCRRVGGLESFLTSSPPRGRACAEVYGGPATARISGRFEGRRVDRRLARTDACEIDDWDRADPLLPDVE